MDPPGVLGVVGWIEAEHHGSDFAPVGSGCLGIKQPQIGFRMMLVVIRDVVGVRRFVRERPRVSCHQRLRIAVKVLAHA